MNESQITETEWWTDLCEGIYGLRQGGARIIIDAENAATGVGKTGLAVYLARLLSAKFDYELKEEDLTLSGSHYLRRWREHPDADQPSVLILDELGGAGAGHARRAMSNQNVELGNAWQLMRKKRIVSIVTLPHWSKADKDMRQQADYRLWCRSDPIGYFRAYRVGSSFDNGSVSTRKYRDVTRIHFPNLDASGDKYYQYLSERKNELLDSEYFDADKLAENDENDEHLNTDDALKKREKEIAREMWADGDSCSKIADAVDRSRGWVSKHTPSRESV